MPVGGQQWKTLGSRYGQCSSPLSFPPSPTDLGNRQSSDFRSPTAPTTFLSLKTKTRKEPYGGVAPLSAFRLILQ